MSLAPAGLSRSNRSAELAILAQPSNDHIHHHHPSNHQPSTTTTNNTGFIVTSRPKQYRKPSDSPPPSTGLNHHASLSSSHSHSHSHSHSQGPSSPSTQYSSFSNNSGTLSHNTSISSDSHRSRTNSPPAAPLRLAAVSHSTSLIGDSANGSASHGSSTPSSILPSTTLEPKTTLHLSSSIDSKGRRMVNQYVRLKTIGTGTYGKVWLCAEPSSIIPDLPDQETSAADADTEGGAIPGPGPRSSQQQQQLANSVSRSFSLAHGLHKYEELTESEGVKYCAIKSVARDGPGRGKSLRAAKNRKASVGSVSPGTGGGACSGGIGSDDKVKREVAIMKRLDHKNVVRLKEVIDDAKSKKVFMVLEFMAGGQVVWQDEDKRPTMSVDEARRTFRDVVLGLEYLHYQGIIHRDIKPANLLWTEDHSTVKISDFGVSHVSDALLRADGEEELDDDKALRKTAGSPAFFAPELCHPAEYTPVPKTPRGPGHADDGYFSSEDVGRASGTPASPLSSASSSTPTTARRTSTIISAPLPSPDPSQPRTRPVIGKGIDVWALGVTLYCLLFGDTPFMARTEYELYNVIAREGVRVPDRMGKEGVWTGVGPGWDGCGDGVEGREVVDLLDKLLQKDPTKRITIAEVKQHPWVLRNLSSPESWLCDTDPAQADTVIVTEEDVKQATQERGAVDTLPPIRHRPGIRRALNAALIRFPAFIKSNRQPASATRSRSKSASSTSQSLVDGASETASSEKPSRHPSDATSSRKKTSNEFGADIRRIISGGRDASPQRQSASAATSGCSTPALGGSRGGWGARLANANRNHAPSSETSSASQTLSSLPPLSRSMSASSGATPSAASRARNLLSSSANGRDSSSSRPESPAARASSDTESSGKRRLTRVLSRLGGGRKTPRPSRKSSASDDDALSVEGSLNGSTTGSAVDGSSISVEDGYNSRVIKSGTRSALEFFAPMSNDFDAPTDFDEIVDTSDYTSDEDDDDEQIDEDLAGPPITKLDGLTGWTDFSTFSVSGAGFTDGLVQEKVPISSFHLESDSTPRASAQLSDLAAMGLDPDPSSTPPPLVRQASDSPSKRPPVVRDGSIRNDYEPTIAPRKWEVYNDEDVSSSEPEHGDYEDDYEDETEIFVAPRRRRAQPSTAAA
ncbi:Pkinase-domain-containing protein [Meredithblackwellia eburnea MCA 4105]